MEHKYLQETLQTHQMSRLVPISWFDLGKTLLLSSSQSEKIRVTNVITLIQPEVLNLTEKCF